MKTVKQIEKEIKKLQKDLVKAKQEELARRGDVRKLVRAYEHYLIKHPESIEVELTGAIWMVKTDKALD